MGCFRPVNLVEALESRLVRSAVTPSPAEQLAVEYINRARANPQAEANRWVGYQDQQGNIYDGNLNEGLAAGTITADAKQPVAINPYLTDAARKHATWVISNSTFDHFETDGKTPGQRMADAGYAFPGGVNNGNWGENMAINYSSATMDAAGIAQQQQRNLFTDQTESDRGHRTNMMEPTRNEIGLGFATGTYNLSGYGPINAIAQTADTATSGQTFLTGVAYTDGVVKDNFYTIGEGLGGITITATDVSTKAVYTATTWSSGGYSLALPAGTYTVVGSGNGLNTSVLYNNVAIGSQNVKKDFITGQAGDGTVDVFSRIRSRTLILTGTVGNDIIGVGARDGYYFAGMGTQQVHYAITLIDAVAVKAGDGNDRVVVNEGVAHSYVEGGYGKDTIIGGEGADTLYGNASIDVIYGNGGDDQLVGENGNDLVYGGAGNDRLYGGAGNDTVFGENGNDRIWGGVGDDILVGGRGRDYLNGEQGSDTLNGNAHTDTAEMDPMDTRIAIEVLL
jgi:Ca2+-binding RTX toxin-like protein